MRLITVNCVNDMKQANLALGDQVKTLGYGTPNDGGGAEYKIVAEQVGKKADAGSLINLGKGRQAQLLYNGIVNVRQFGAIADGMQNAGPAIKAAVEFMASQDGGTLDFCGGHYFLSFERIDTKEKDYNKLIVMGSHITYEGNGARLTVDKLLGSAYPYLFYHGDDSATVEGCTIRNFTFEGVRPQAADIGLTVEYAHIFVYLVHARNCVVEQNCFKEGCVLINMLNTTEEKTQGSYNNVIRNNLFEAQDYRTNLEKYITPMKLTDLYKG